MSEVKLHGHAVKIGDKVWIISHGWTEVTEINPVGLYKIQAGIFTFTEHGERFIGDGYAWLYWHPIDPAAIEAAKVKPKEPEYEWQWLFKCDDGICEASAFYKNEPSSGNGRALICRIEESKREVKP